MEAQWGLDLRRLDLEIQGERRRAEFRREQQTEDQESTRSTRIEDAKAAATVEVIERHQDAKDAEMALDLYRQFRGIKRDDQSARERAQLEAEERKLALSLDAEERRVAMRLKESQEHHDRELKRIEALSSAGIETLIAVSSPEHAQLLAQLARTRAFSGCSPDQILAMQAENNPQITEALKEILTATAASGQLEQYERLVTELRGSAQNSREDSQRNLQIMNEMFDKALDSVKDTAVTFSSVTSAPAIARPDVRSQAGPDGTVTLLFTDIEGSTAMTVRLGDLRAQEVLRAHNSIVREQVEVHGGFEVKSMGDGFMLAFSSARNAIDCATYIQCSFAGYNDQHPAEPIRVRMGLHTGEAIKEGEDFFGKNVILAARIASKADGGRILVSSLSKELTESSEDIRFGQAVEVELKGLPGTSRVYQVVWERTTP